LKTDEKEKETRAPLRKCAEKIQDSGRKPAMDGTEQSQLAADRAPSSEKYLAPFFSPAFARYLMQYLGQSDP
jgi:hypothetical protein